MRLPPNSAGRAVFVLFLALTLAGLLDANGLRKQAQTQPTGFKQDVALDVTRPLVRVSHALYLTSPRHELQMAIGRSGEDTIDSQVHLKLLPTGSAHTTARRMRTPSRSSHSLTTKPTFAPDRPLRVWVAGDSLAQVPGEALERLGGAIDVVGIESRLSTGLSRPDLYNWFTRIQRAPAELHPRVAVLSFGADDAHDFMAGVPDGRILGPLGTPSWNAEYRRRADGVTRELIAAGIHAVWVGLPIPDGPGFRRGFAVVNRILESVVRAHPGQAAFVDTWHLLDDAHGRYTPYLRVHGKLTLMRLPDGVHYTAAAGDLIAAELVRQLRKFYNLHT